MGYLEVLFEVPSYIEHGLASGLLERVGGVIRYVDGKQVVAWLRDSSMFTDTAGQLLMTAANPLSGVLQAAQTASSIYDKYVTRNMLSALGNQISTNHLATMTVLNNLGASVQMVTAISSLTLGGQLLNLALSTATLVTINKRLGDMSKQLEGMEAKILAEFEQNRDVNFAKGLEAAKDVFESQNEKNRAQAHRSAVDYLFEARSHLLANFDKILSSKNLNRNRLTMAQNHLVKQCMRKSLVFVLFGQWKIEMLLSIASRKHCHSLNPELYD